MWKKSHVTAADVLLPTIQVVTRVENLEFTLESCCLYLSLHAAKCRFNKYIYLFKKIQCLVASWLRFLPPSQHLCYRMVFSDYYTVRVVVHPDDSPREESWAQRARDAAKRDKMVVCVHRDSRGSRRHMGKSTSGRDSSRRSLCRSRGAAHGMSGNTVKRQPQPFTEPSLVNFQRISSPAAEKEFVTDIHIFYIRSFILLMLGYEASGILL